MIRGLRLKISVENLGFWAWGLGSGVEGLGFTGAARTVATSYLRTKPGLSISSANTHGL